MKPAAKKKAAITSGEGIKMPMSLIVGEPNMLLRNPERTTAAI